MTAAMAGQQQQIQALKIFKLQDLKKITTNLFKCKDPTGHKLLCVLTISTLPPPKHTLICKDTNNKKFRCIFEIVQTKLLQHHHTIIQKAVIVTLFVKPKVKTQIHFLDVVVQKIIVKVVHVQVQHHFKIIVLKQLADFTSPNVVTITCTSCLAQQQLLSISAPITVNNQNEVNNIVNNINTINNNNVTTATNIIDTNTTITNAPQTINNNVTSKNSISENNTVITSPTNSTIGHFEGGVYVGPNTTAPIQTQTPTPPLTPQTNTSSSDNNPVQSDNNQPSTSDNNNTSSPDIIQTPNTDNNAPSSTDNNTSQPSTTSDNNSCENGLTPDSNGVCPTPPQAQTQTCADGSVIALTDTCPSPPTDNQPPTTDNQPLPPTDNIPSGNQTGQ